MHSTPLRRLAAATLAVSLLPAALTACSEREGDGSPAYSTTTADTGSGSDGDLGEGDIRLSLGYVRAKPAEGGDSGSSMTAIFGTLRNKTDHEITVTGFSTSLDSLDDSHDGDPSYEIHETADGKMRRKEGGITIPAGGEHELAPGGDHFMIMDYAPEIPAGASLDLTLDTDDGERIEIPGLSVRTVGAGDEDYADHTDHADHAGHNH